MQIILKHCLTGKELIFNCKFELQQFAKIYFRNVNYGENKIIDKIKNDYFVSISDLCNSLHGSYNRIYK